MIIYIDLRNKNACFYKDMSKLGIYNYDILICRPDTLYMHAHSKYNLMVIYKSSIFRHKKSPCYIITLITVMDQ